MEPGKSSWDIGPWWHWLLILLSSFIKARALELEPKPVKAQVSWKVASKAFILIFLFQLTELEQRVVEAETRAEDAEDKVSQIFFYEDVLFQSGGLFLLP